jgi:serine/threonine protein phosphatase 1
MMDLFRPLPRGSAHRPPRVAADERIYAVGDIHGRFDLMIALLDRIGADAETHRDRRRTRIVFLGDYIDRGDDSRSVLDTVIELSSANSPDLIFLRGNHEDALMAFLEDPVAGRSWLRYGAKQTFASYGLPPVSSRTADARQLHDLRDRLAAAMGPQIDILQTMPTHFVSGNVLFTHAGANPQRPLQDTRAMIWGHADFPSEGLVQGLRVVHGHYDDATPVSEAGRICVDTGAYYTGQLTAVRLDRDEAFLTAGP